MKSLCLILTIAAMLFCTGIRANSPKDLPLKEDGITEIECDVSGKAIDLATFNRDGKAILSTKTTGYHYRLYLPKGYMANTDTYYPAMFIASPSGNAGMGKMANRLKRDGWIVVMLVESRNASLDWLNSFTATYDDVVQRVRIAQGLKFATGMSGGARCISVYPCVRPGFRGIICQAAGFLSEFKNVSMYTDIYAKYPRHVAVAATFGNKDFNAYESQRFRRTLNRGCDRYVEFFSGGHSWCPESSFDTVMDWMEEVTFLNKPTAATNSNLLGINVRAESVDQQGYKWYIGVLKQRLAAAGDDPVARYHLLSKIVTTIKNGRLTYDNELKSDFAKMNNERMHLMKTAAVQNEVKAQREYEKAMKEFASFEATLTRGKAVHKKLYFTRAERARAAAFSRACDSVIKNYPDSIYAKRLSAMKTSVMDLEIKDAALE